MKKLNKTVDIEVTPSMIEAGMDAYLRKDRYLGDDPIDEETLIDIYRAMMSVAQNGSKSG